MPTPEIDDIEIVFRQAGRVGNPLFIDTTRQPPIHHSLFRPTALDTDGLSLIRSKYRSEIWAAYRTERPEIRYYLIHLVVERLKEIADTTGFDFFTLRPNEDTIDEENGEPWAHCVVEQVNVIDYQNDVKKKLIKEWALALEATVSINDISGPYDTPTQLEPVRPLALELP